MSVVDMTTGEIIHEASKGVLNDECFRNALSHALNEVGNL